MSLIAQTHASFHRPLGCRDIFWRDEKNHCQSVVREAVTTAVRYPQSLPHEHCCKVETVYSEQELCSIQSAESLVRLMVYKKTVAMDRLKSAIHEAGLRILPVDLSKGIPRIEFEKHLQGSGI